MKKKAMAVCLLLFLLLAGCRPARSEFAVPTAEIDVCFSPHGGCTEAIVGEIEKAAVKASSFRAYSFTSKPIAAALLDAHRRGVHIEAILDKSNRTEQYSEADFLAHAENPHLHRPPARRSRTTRSSSSTVEPSLRCLPISPIRQRHPTPRTCW